MKVLILLLASTMVEGTFRKEGWEGEVTPKTAKTLVGMSKASYTKDELEEIKIEFDVTNVEEFETLKTENIEIKTANAYLIVAKEDAEIRAETLKEENKALKKQVDRQQALSKTLYDDIFSMTFKELKEKYQ